MGIMRDGFSTVVDFADNPNISLRMHEKEVTPPGIDGGGENDTTTMRNTAWRTRQPKYLKTLTPANFNAAYDAAVYDDIVAACNQNQLITVTFPEGDTLAFWGWLNTFTPNASVEGEQPTAECEVIPSNQDNSGNEVEPNYTAAP